MTGVVGYFQWRRNLKGEYSPYKLAVEHKYHTPKGNTVVEHPLTSDQYKLGLDVLSQIFPAPQVPDAPQRSDQAKSET